MNYQGLSLVFLSFWPCCRRSRRAPSPSPSTPSRISPLPGRSRSAAASSKTEPSCGPAASQCCGSSSTSRPCRPLCVLGWFGNWDWGSGRDTRHPGEGLCPRSGPGDAGTSHCVTGSRHLCWWWWSPGDSGGCASPKKRCLTCGALCPQHPWRPSATCRGPWRATHKEKWGRRRKRWLSPGVCELLLFWLGTGDYTPCVLDSVYSPLTFSHISSLCLCLPSCWSEVKVRRKGGRCIEEWWPWPGFCPATRGVRLMCGLCGGSHTALSRPEVEEPSSAGGGDAGPPHRLYPPLTCSWRGSAPWWDGLLEDTPNLFKRFEQRRKILEASEVKKLRKALKENYSYKKTSKEQNNTLFQ